MSNPLIQEELQKFFYYRDGSLFRKEASGNYPADSRVGHVHKATGYVTCRWRGINYKVHRMIWVLLKGAIPDDMSVDHLNRKKTDNRIENMRLASHSEQQLNKESSLETTGVTFHSEYNRYQASMRVNGKKIYFGTYGSFEEAHAAYLAGRELHRQSV